MGTSHHAHEAYSAPWWPESGFPRPRLLLHVQFHI